jgi:hypothetical protein
MKAVFLGVLILLTSCTSIDKELQSAISYGEIKELNQYSSTVEKQLFIRLYRSKVYKENCFKETQDACQYRYFLSVSSYDESPETNIFPLDEIGEITNIEWKKSSNVDSAIIDFTVEKYTKEAITNNPSLVSKQVIIRVTVTPNFMEESRQNAQ